MARGPWHRPLGYALFSLLTVNYSLFTAPTAVGADFLKSAFGDQAVVERVLGHLQAVLGEDHLAAALRHAVGERLDRLIGDPETARRMGDNARELATSSYAQDRVAEKLEGFYEKALNNFEQ